MKQWFSQLSADERRYVMVGGGMTVVFLLYFMGWQPLVTKIERLEKSNKTLAGDLRWMDKASLEVKQIRAQQGGGVVTQVSSSSLLSTVDQTAKRRQLGPFVKRIEPSGDNAVRVWLENADFDKVIVWAAQLKNKKGIVIRTMNLERQQTAGKINATVVLEVPKA